MTRNFLAFVCSVAVVACGGGSKGSKDGGPDGGPKPQCSDGIDNDGDGKIDYPNDPGCVVPQQDDETDDCPDGPACPQCSNGKDDDGNGATDYPDDPGCTSSGDYDELTENPVACGNNITIHQVPADGADMGTVEATQLFPNVSTCGGGGANGIPVYAYELHLNTSKVVVASTTGSTVDTVLDIRSADCKTATSEIACNDDAMGTASSVTASLLQGTYYILVESKTGAAGPFMLNVQLFNGEGQACSSQPECGPGLVCRVPHGGTTMSCEKPVCSDGRDDDGDGKMDFPADPGCTSLTDDDESDDCPNGPMCPACGNGRDDDGDGLTDYPNDTSCRSASGTSEASCPNDMENYGSITMPTNMGDLTAGHKDLTFTCSLTPSGNDASFILNLSVPVASLTLDTEGSSVSDTQIELWSGTCTTALGCDDDGGTSLLSLLTVNNLAAGTYAISVAAYSTSSNGPFTLNVHGTIASGSSCESPLVTTGVLACATGTTCQGTVGMRKCM